jgi:hypothetical protein
MGGSGSSINPKAPEAWEILGAAALALAPMVRAVWAWEAWEETADVVWASSA